MTFTLKGTPSPGSAGCRSSTCHWAKRLAGKKHKTAQNQRIVRGSRFTVRGIRFTFGVWRLAFGVCGVVPRDLLTGANRAVQSEKLTVNLPNFFRGRDETAKRRTPTAERRTPNAERRTPNAKRQTPNAERRTPNAERRTPNAKRQTPNANPSPRSRKRSGNRGSSFPGLRCERRSQQISLLLESAAILLR